jgi:hypothetical protein
VWGGERSCSTPKSGHHQDLVFHFRPHDLHIKLLADEMIRWCIHAVNWLEAFFSYLMHFWCLLLLLFLFFDDVIEWPLLSLNLKGCSWGYIGCENCFVSSFLNVVVCVVTCFPLSLLQMFWPGCGGVGQRPGQTRGWGCSVLGRARDRLFICVQQQWRNYLVLLVCFIG